MARETLHGIYDDTREEQVAELTNKIGDLKTTRRIWRINGAGSWLLYWVLVRADLHAVADGQHIPNVGIATTIMTASAAVGGLGRAVYLSRRIQNNTAELESIQADLAAWPPIDSIPADAEPVDPNPNYSWA